jgi:hypothetical protein
VSITQQILSVGEIIYKKSGGSLLRSGKPAKTLRFHGQPTIIDHLAETGRGE